MECHWFENLYVSLRLLSEVLGYDDVKEVERILLQAGAGVVQSADATVVAIEFHRDFNINSRELRDAGERMLRAIAHLLLNQAHMEQRL
jgi:F0F1-type ATP synthase epsilon subunit